MKKTKWLFAGIGAAVIAIIAVAIILIVNYKETYRNINVLEKDGTVVVSREQKSIDAYSKMKLRNGDYVTVDDESYLRLKLDDDKYVYVKEGSKFSLESAGNSKDNRTRIYLDEGEMVTEIQSKISENSSYEIVSPNSTMCIRGTVTIFKVMNNNGVIESTAFVKEGLVDFISYAKDSSGDIVKVTAPLKQGEGISIGTDEAVTLDKDVVKNLLDDSSIISDIGGVSEQKTDSIQKLADFFKSAVPSAILKDAGIDDFDLSYVDINEVKGASHDDPAPVNDTAMTQTPVEQSSSEEVIPSNTREEAISAVEEQPKEAVTAEVQSAEESVAAQPEEAVAEEAQPAEESVAAQPEEAVAEEAQPAEEPVAEQPEEAVAEEAQPAEEPVAAQSEEAVAEEAQPEEAAAEETKSVEKEQPEKVEEEKKNEEATPLDEEKQVTPVPTPVPVPTSVPTPVPTPVPTSVPTPIPTSVPTPIPTSVPTPIPTSVPTPVPTSVPTPIPTSVPTPIPTSVPTPIPTPKYNISWVHDGNTYDQSSYEEDEVIAETSVTPNVDHMNFIGWYYEENSERKDFVQGMTMPDHDLVMFADFEPERYNVYYNINGGEFNSSYDSSVYGEYLFGTGLLLPTSDLISKSIMIPSAEVASALSNRGITKATFCGWYLDKLLTQQVSEFTGQDFGDKMVYAKWENDAAYTVHYIADIGGTQIKIAPDKYGVGTAGELHKEYGILQSENNSYIDEQYRELVKFLKSSNDEDSNGIEKTIDPDGNTEYTFNYELKQIAIRARFYYNGGQMENDPDETYRNSNPVACNLSLDTDGKLTVVTDNFYTLNCDDVIKALSDPVMGLLQSGKFLDKVDGRSPEWKNGDYEYIVSDLIVTIVDEYYAQWLDIYNITYEFNGIKLKDDFERSKLNNKYHKGESIYLPTADDLIIPSLGGNGPERKFLGWYTSNGFTDDTFLSLGGAYLTSELSGDITLYARYSYDSEIIVHYVIDGADYSNEGPEYQDILYYSYSADDPQPEIDENYAILVKCGDTVSTYTYSKDMYLKYEGDVTEGLPEFNGKLIVKKNYKSYECKWQAYYWAGNSGGDRFTADYYTEDVYESAGECEQYVLDECRGRLVEWLKDVHLKEGPESYDYLIQMNKRYTDDVAIMEIKFKVEE